MRGAWPRTSSVPNPQFERVAKERFGNPFATRLGGARLEGGNPMTLTMLAGFNAVVALALGFVLGRIWQIRRYELEQRGFATPPVARIPRA